MGTAKKRRSGPSGAPLSHKGRAERGFVRIDVNVPADTVPDLELIVATEAAETGLARAQAPAVLRAIRERAARIRKKK